MEIFIFIASFILTIFIEISTAAQQQNVTAANNNSNGNLTSSLLLMGASRFMNGYSSKNGMADFLAAAQDPSRSQDVLRIMQALIYNSGGADNFVMPSSTTTQQPESFAIFINGDSFNYTGDRDVVGMYGTADGYTPRNQEERMLVVRNRQRFQGQTCIECCPVNCVQRGTGCNDCLHFDESVYRDCTALNHELNTDTYLFTQRKAAHFCFSPNDENLVTL